MWNSNHEITKALRNKMVLEALLTCMTLFMGAGAFLQAPSEFWQFSYICRVGLLLISPFVLYRLVKACRTIIKAKDLTDGKTR
jgi:hypothetical protein